MAGTVFLEDGRDWSTSSSIFYWTLDALADRASEPLAEILREISEYNLGMLSLDDLTPEQRTELVGLVAELPTTARAELPQSDGRDAILAQLDELAALLSGGPSSAD